MRILLDADFLVALAKVDDLNHARAISIAKELQGSFFFTTFFTIPETTTVLSYKISQDAAKKFLAEARKMNVVELSFDKRISDFTDELFLSIKSKGTSWIDCLNVVYTKEYQLDGILSFDKFYKKQGVKNF